jgi:C4-dicarboxylate-specific signal transduction histidine kinase
MMRGRKETIAPLVENLRATMPYLIAAALVLVSFLARLALAPWMADRSPLLPFIAAVVVAAGLYGVGPGLLAIGLSVLLATLTFIAPAAEAGLTLDQIVSIGVFVVTSAAMLIFSNHLREARRQAEQLEVELHQTQATAAMGAMASTLAHELNQPLTAAANYVAACQQLVGRLKEERQPALLTGLTKAESQIQRAGAIIRNARALVRKVPVERDIASLRRMFDRVIDLLRASDVGSKVRFAISIEPPADLVSVNSVQIEQVLLNIARNACEAMSKGRDRPQLRFKATATARGSLVEIRDSGPGISRDRLSSLFSAADTPSSKGLGIGLSISRTIVEAHGGSIWAQNNPEGGASFFVLLPIVDEN